MSDRREIDVTSPSRTVLRDFEPPALPDPRMRPDPQAVIDKMIRPRTSPVPSRQTDVQRRGRSATARGVAPVDRQPSGVPAPKPSRSGTPTPRGRDADGLVSLGQAYRPWSQQTPEERAAEAADKFRATQAYLQQALDAVTGNNHN